MEGAIEYENQKCNSCRFWHRIHNLLDLNDKSGECRYGPPSTTIHMTQRGPMSLTGYPRCREDMPACSKIELRVLVEEVPNGQN